MINEIQLE
jgi:hypothetical protein